jgi:diguanylate cyclase (GGDEF)-like protein
MANEKQDDRLDSTPDLASLDDEATEADADRTVIQGIPKIAPSSEKRQASLIVISGGSAGKIFRLSREPMTIGRAKDCEISIDDEGISRRHARLQQDNFGNVTIEDLGSTNGTYINGTRINQQALRDGDKVQVGSITILKFSFQDSLEEAFFENQYRQATFDALTGLYNKKMLLERLEKEFLFSLRNNRLLSLVMFDLDHFKRINDTHGHPAGDHVLKTLAQIMLKNLRQEDFLARFGGEEFVLMLRDLDEVRCHTLAERLRRSVEKHHFEWDNRRIPVTISMGIATLREGNFRDGADMLRVADEYLYKAKRNGRNCVASILR